jgi:uncharacterized protein (TIGR02421 family)
MIPAGLADKLDHGSRIRSRLPGGGLLQIDRALPFLCVHRQHPDHSEIGSDKLITSEASFLIANGEKRWHKPLSDLIKTVTDRLEPQFGAFLILEIWSEEWDDDGVDLTNNDLVPGFKIVASSSSYLSPTIRVLESALRLCQVKRTKAKVSIEYRKGRISPPGLSSIWPKTPTRDSGIHIIGLAVRPIFRDRNNEEGVCEVFPTILRGLRRSMSRAIRRGLFEFTRRTAHRPPHFQALGPRSVTKGVYEVDRRLSGICDNFEYLLQVTPVNSHESWLTFKRNRFEKLPRFDYRPLPFEPASLKRKLYQAPMEQVEDPVLAEIFREKQDELDRLITSMGDCNTKLFLPGSLQVFGGVEPDLKQLANEILSRTPVRLREKGNSSILNAAQVAAAAKKEISQYQKIEPGFGANIEIRSDLPPGIMVGKGEILIGRKTEIPAKRINALLNHEVGVHLVTHHNGFSQPFKLLGHGLAGYESLQEGLAVFAEYLVGGLTRSRLRILAGRVIAVHAVIQGADFVETFRILSRELGFSQRASFMVAMRVYRGGGLTKDAIYLRGVKDVMDFVADGGDLTPLWTGKIALRHLPIIQELKWRAVLSAPALIPKFIKEQTAKSRIIVPVK